MPAGEREAGMPGGPSSFIFPFSHQSIEQIGRLVDSYLKEVLGEGRQKAGSPGPRGSARRLQLSIRVFAEHIEVTMGARGGEVAFGSWLGDALRREGLSQESAARRVGVSLKTVNRWLRGHSEPRLRELRRVREAFGDPPL